MWSDALESHFQLNSEIDEVQQSPSIENGLVVLAIGGGHYVPKLNDLARLGDGLYIGHALTTYALKDHLDPTNEGYIADKYKEVIREAIQSTRITYGVQYILHVCYSSYFINNVYTRRRRCDCFAWWIRRLLCLSRDA
jgi:D-tyrosyl-tRNA(Tyr) deacylase